LLAEVFYLKNELLRHTDCNCVLIQKYIAHEIKTSVGNIEGTSEPFSRCLGLLNLSSRGSIDCSNSVSSTIMAPDHQTLEQANPLQQPPGTPSPQAEDCISRPCPTEYGLP
jgi:hypothetical protein